MQLELERTRRIDIVCPRTQAIVYFGGGEEDPLQPTANQCLQSGRKEFGLAPEALVEAASDGGRSGKA